MVAIALVTTTRRRAPLVRMLLEQGPLLDADIPLGQAPCPVCSGTGLSPYWRRGSVIAPFKCRVCQGARMVRQSYLAQIAEQQADIAERFPITICAD